MYKKYFKHNEKENNRKMISAIVFFSMLMLTLIIVLSAFDTYYNGPIQEPTYAGKPSNEVDISEFDYVPTTNEFIFDDMNETTYKVMTQSQEIKAE